MTEAAVGIVIRENKDGYNRMLHCEGSCRSRKCNMGGITAFLCELVQSMLHPLPAKTVRMGR